MESTKHIVQLTQLPANSSTIEEAHLALDAARFWGEKVSVVVEWGTISSELKNNLSNLSEYIFNTKLPIIILGCPKTTEDEIYSRVCKLYFQTL